MILVSARMALPLAVLSCLTLAGPASAVAPEIKDEAKVFSPEAVKKANDMIRDIARKHGVDFLVETFNTVPGEQAEKVKGLDPQERTKFFQSWARERINHHVVHGVYVLVCKNPQYIRVEVSDKAVSRFGSAFGKTLGDLLVADFKEKKFDEALLTAVKQVQEKLAAAKPKK
jgi:uncharacterized membrane protein YgcG